MHSGETILVIGGLVLLTIFAVSLNHSMTANQSTMYQSEQILDAFAIAQRYIEQAEILNFDENSSATIPSSFTYASNLGPDTGEYYPNFDDVDDYHNLSLTDTTSGYIPYTINVTVNYVNLATPDQPTTSRTYYKRMVATVSSPHLNEVPSNSITMRRLFCYHYFYTD